MGHTGVSQNSPNNGRTPANAESTKLSRLITALHLTTALLFRRQEIIFCLDR